MEAIAKGIITEEHDWGFTFGISGFSIPDTRPGKAPGARVDCRQLTAQGKTAEAARENFWNLWEWWSEEVFGEQIPIMLEEYII